MGRNNDQINLLFFDDRNDLLDRFTIPNPFCNFETVSLFGFYDTGYVFSGVFNQFFVFLL